MNLTGAGKIAGVIGWPVRQSLSPVLHGYWLREKNIDGVLVPVAARPEDFSTVLTGLRKAGFRGVSVTVPHKQAAFALAEISDPAAQAAGAVNLLIFHEDGRIEGRNTDAMGLRQCLAAGIDGDIAGKSAVLLGAGGAARAAVLALDGISAARIHILNRHCDRAEALVAQLQPMVKSQLRAGTLADWAGVAGGASLLVNATSAGMIGRAPLELDLTPLPVSAAVCDVVFNPLETELLAKARARGHLCLDGLGMLMHQAVPAFEAFFGVRPQVSPGLHTALVEVLTPKGRRPPDHGR
jgi:shikimate dehydrogenase